MRKQLLLAILVLAMAFILGCSDDSVVGNNSNSYSFSCQLSNGNCIPTATDSDCSQAGGFVVGFCSGQNVYSSSSSSRNSISSSSSYSISSSPSPSPSSSSSISSSNPPSLSSSSMPGSSSSSAGSGPSPCVQGNVTIGTQVWQKCNSDAVPSKGVYKCYDDLESNCQKSGKLYDWEAANNVCPSGFHLPSNTDWDKLIYYVDGSTSGTGSSIYKSFTAGNNLKAESGWSRGGNGTDDHGFSALPGGYGYSADDNFDYKYEDKNVDGQWWSASEYNSVSAYYWRINYLGGTVFCSERGVAKSYLFSVRCIQD